MATIGKGKAPAVNPAAVLIPLMGWLAGAPCDSQSPFVPESAVPVVVPVTVSPTGGTGLQSGQPAWWKVIALLRTWLGRPALRMQ